MTVRTVTLPTNPAALWTDFQWPPKAPGDELHYTLDAKAWLKDAGATIAGFDVECSAELVVTDFIMVGGSSIVLQIKGGMPETTAQVRLLLSITGRDTLDVLVCLPIRAEPPLGLQPVQFGGGVAPLFVSVI